MKGVIVYKGKYGATEEYATILAKTLNLPLFSSTITGRMLIDADYVLIGSAVYVGKLSVRSWLHRNQTWLQNKKLFFFIVSGTSAADAEKTAQIIKANIPEALQQNDIFFLKGRLIQSQLSWLDRLVLKLGAWFTKDPVQKKKMLQDFDGVHPEATLPIIQVLKAWKKEQHQEPASCVFNPIT